jgi:hypothetical protein
MARRVKRRTPPAVKGLSPGSRHLFKKLAEEYAIADAGGMQILLSGLKSLDLAQAAEAAIRKDGQVVRDRWNQAKAHPLTAAARDHRAAWLAALRGLNLAIGDPPKPGRPEGT